MPNQKQADNLNRFAHTAMLYDFYGPLLTKKQGEVIEMYFMNDLSLSEISAELGITRQAAGILINRTVKILDGYESKLGLVKKHTEAKGRIEFIMAELKEISEAVCFEAGVIKRLDNAISVIGEL